MARTSRKTEYDSIYLFKILLYLILGSVWVAFGPNRVLPIGLITGLIIAQHERLQVDRKIEYALLIVASIVGLTGIGITIHL